MRSKLELVLIIIGILISCVLVYGLLNQNKMFELFYKFGGDYEEYVMNNTHIYVPPNLETNSNEYLKKLEPTRQVATKLFNFEYDNIPSMSFFVVVPGNRGFERVQNLTGSYLPNQRVILLNGERALFGTIIHEYSHFLFDLYLEDRDLAIEDLPVWLVEGLAEYMAFQIENALPVNDYVYKVLSLEQLNAWDSSNTNTVNLQGFYMVYDLIENYGEDIIVQLVDTYKNTNNFKTTFEKVTGESFDHYHEKFEMDLNKINDLSEKEQQEMMEQIIVLLENKTSINQYSPIMLPILINLSLNLEDIDLAKNYFFELDRILFDPKHYLEFAQQFINAGEEVFAKQIVEKGLNVAKQYLYDVESYENEVEKIFKTTLP